MMRTDAEAIVQVAGLHAGYGRGGRRVEALRGVDLHVRSGEIFGLLGPNGAGKTTLLAVLEGLHRPDRGSVCVAGVDVVRNPQQVKPRLGIQLQHTTLMDDLTAGELLRVYAAMYAVYPSRGEIEAALAGYGLAGQADVFPRRLSGGQQQRLALAIAQVNRPALVLLDEPAAALDPHARRAVWELIRRMQAEGRTVILTTHSMEEAEALCERVAIIDGGQVIACDTPARLVAQLGAASRIVLTDVLTGTIAGLGLERALALAGVCGGSGSGGQFTIETHDPLRTLAALYALAQAEGVRLGDITLRRPNLEDVFLSLTGRGLGEGV